MTISAPITVMTGMCNAVIDRSWVPSLSLEPELESAVPASCGLAWRRRGSLRKIEVSLPEQGEWVLGKQIPIVKTVRK